MTELYPRVVITGLGVVTPIGGTLDSFWSGLLEGRCGISPIRGFDCSNMSTRIGGQIHDFDLRRYVQGQIKTARLARHSQLALAALTMALEDADLDRENWKPSDERLSIFLGISTSSLYLLETGFSIFQEHGPKRVKPFLIEASAPHGATALLSTWLGIPTEVSTLCTACSAGMDALQRGLQAIQSGKTDLVVIGGTDAPLTAYTMSGFCTSGMLSTRNEDPARASRPFDSQRDGGLLSEGCGVLVLENLEAALARGAKIYAEVRSVSIVTDPPGGAAGIGFEISMHRAMADAGIRPESVDFINAHGPSDKRMDRNEALCIERLWGKGTPDLPVTSIKGNIGNPLAGASPLQLAASCMAIQEGIIPFTANHERTDDDLSIQIVHTAPRRTGVNTVITNTHGIGGVNATAVLSKVRLS